MKIGILTHHYINNFGAFLQAYALQTALQEMYPNDEARVIGVQDLELVGLARADSGDEDLPHAGGVT